MLVERGVLEHGTLWYYLYRTKFRDLKRATPNMRMVST